MANIKFSQFTAEADIANFDDIVGYAGAINTRITPANLASSLITLSGGPYLPLTAGASEKLTGDLNLARDELAGSGVQTAAFAVAGKEIFGTITSSPFLIPAAFKARNKATVPLVVATAYLTFNNLQIFFSKFPVLFPSFIKLLFKTEFKFFFASLILING